MSIATAGRSSHTDVVRAAGVPTGKADDGTDGTTLREVHPMGTGNDESVEGRRDVCEASAGRLAADAGSGAGDAGRLASGRGDVGTADTDGKDDFDLYDLKVEVVAGDRPFVCGHQVGDAFYVRGENLVFERGTSFSMYALAAILPMLPAKQRPLQRADWMLSDEYIACPDPNCGARFRITRVGRRTLSHGQTTVVPIARE